MLHYCPLESYKDRYTSQWSGPITGWQERNWIKAGIDYVRIDGDTELNPCHVKGGVVLSPVRRTLHCFAQIEKILTLAEQGLITSKDVIYFDDFWHLGFEALRYTFDQLKIRPKMYAYCHAQSVDEFDFTFKMKSWIRGFEHGIADCLNGIFVGSTILKELLDQNGIGAPTTEWSNHPKIHVVGHPFNSEEVMERMPFWYQKKSIPYNENKKRENKVVFSSRWDEEKNPLFFLKLAARIPDAHFVICTSSPKIRSNNPDLLIPLCNLLPNVTLKENITKEEYYTELVKAKIQFNCLSGETPILTKNGAKPIKDLVGKVDLMSERGEWISSKIKSYGKQKVHELTFGRGSNSSFCIKATEDHRWYLANGRIRKTSELKHGDIIAQVAVRPPIENEDDYLRGIQHGIIFGDGSARNKNGPKNGFQIRLCQHKQELLRFFPDFPHSYPPSCDGDPIVYLKASACWDDLKELPEKYSMSYLLGFFRGWLATDGSMSSRMHSFSLSGSITHITWARNHCALIGWHPGSQKLERARKSNFGISSTVRMGFYADTIWDDDLLLRSRADKLENLSTRGRVYIFKSSQYVGREEVFCATVPRTQNFALWNGMLTGNCADQDFISIALLEATTAGCYPIYPNFRSFPEVFRYNPKYLYEHKNLDDAVSKVQSILKQDDLWTYEEINKRSWIYHRYDSSWGRMINIMGLTNYTIPMNFYDLQIPESAWRKQ